MINNFIFIKATDFACTGVVTASCNLNKLCIAIEDAYVFDIEPLLCTGFMIDVMDKWTEIINLPIGDPIPENLKKWYDLIFGSIYTDCNGKLNRHLGIKLLWIYYSYANYITLNPFDDTANGLKYKTNEWSSPVPIKDLNGLSISYKNKASDSYKGIKEFLCLDKDFFATFDSCNCHLSCGCLGACSCGKTKKVSTGFRYKSIKKK